MPPDRAVVLLHGGGDAARPRGRVPRGGRNTARADPDRGHVFTDRLLHARGMLETMFLGAERYAPLLATARSDAASRPGRASRSLPMRVRQARSAAAAERVVAFSAGEVYAHRRADPPPSRRLRGGDGTRSRPRTRNAQVAMYQEKRSTSWSRPTRSGWG